MLRTVVSAIGYGREREIYEKCPLCGTPNPHAQSVCANPRCGVPLFFDYEVHRVGRRTAWTYHHEYYGLVIFLACFAALFYMRSHLWAKVCLGGALLGLALSAEGIIVEYLKKWKDYPGPGPVHRGYWWVLDRLIDAAYWWSRFLEFMRGL